MFPRDNGRCTCNVYRFDTVVQYRGGHLVALLQKMLQMNNKMLHIWLFWKQEESYRKTISQKSIVKFNLFLKFEDKTAEFNL